LSSFRTTAEESAVAAPAVAVIADLPASVVILSAAKNPYLSLRWSQRSGGDRAKPIVPKMEPPQNKSQKHGVFSPPKKEAI
jgi:hypothetical protein